MVAFNLLLLQDSKVFVDKPLLHPVEDVLKKFEKLPDRNKVICNKEIQLSKLKYLYVIYRIQ